MIPLLALSILVTGLLLWHCRGRKIVRSALRSKAEHVRLVEEEWIAPRLWTRFRRLNCIVSVSANSLECEPHTPCEYVRRVLEPLRRCSPLCEQVDGTVNDAFAKHGFEGVRSVDVIRNGERVNSVTCVQPGDKVALFTLFHRQCFE